MRAGNEKNLKMVNRQQVEKHGRAPREIPSDMPHPIFSIRKET
jgi:hypothetical protein